jgi:hypothetical protein
VGGTHHEPEKIQRDDVCLVQQSLSRQGGEECRTCNTCSTRHARRCPPQAVPSCTPRAYIITFYAESTILNYRTFMSTLMHHVIIALMIVSSVFAGCAQHDQYIAAALEHADRAITNGMERDNNALAEQATVALRYVWLAGRKNEDRHLQDAIRLLKDGIQYARYGRSDDGVQAVQAAYKLLADIQ